MVAQPKDVIDSCGGKNAIFAYDMDMHTDFFKGKKVTVMRIGLLGRGIGDTAYLVEAGAEVTVVDAASPEVMQPAIDQLEHYTNITWKFGPYDFVDFKDSDLVLVGAGTPQSEPVLVQCREAGIRLTQSAALFAELSGVPILGVTGTRGKSTVTHMIHHVLSVVTGEEILLGGNIRGVSNLELLNKVHEDSLCVMELDSWQLQAFGWAQISPHISVFTNFMSDHLNYYQTEGVSREEAMERYFADKSNIFLYQEDSGVFITTPAVFGQAEVFAKGKGITLGQEVVLVDESTLPENCFVPLPGEHNQQNLALAYSALKALSLSDEEIGEGLASFPGVPGRLEYLKELRGVHIYNDNNATTPEATMAGLLALGDVEEPNIILIVGGAYKSLDPKPLIDLLSLYVKKLIVLPGTGSEQLLAVLAESQFEPSLVTEVVTLSEAVETGLASGKPGDILLFSPAFASFGLFKNEYDRNDQFVNSLESYGE